MFHRKVYLTLKRNSDQLVSPNAVWPKFNSQLFFSIFGRKTLFSNFIYFLNDRFLKSLQNYISDKLQILKTNTKRHDFDQTVFGSSAMSQKYCIPHIRCRFDKITK